jgi:hypothetical protein
MILLFVLLGVFGAAISRLHGGGWGLSLPKVVNNALWALPLGLASFWAAGVWFGLVAFAMCLAGKATGHGNFMDLGRFEGESKDEALEFIIKPLRERISVFWYDLIGLAIVGFAAVSGAALAFGLNNVIAGVVIALGGLAGKPLAYVIGWALQDKIKSLPYDFNHPTAIGELLTGFFAYFCLAVSIYVVGIGL